MKAMKKAAGATGLTASAAFTKVAETTELKKKRASGARTRQQKDEQARVKTEKRKTEKAMRLRNTTAQTARLRSDFAARQPPRQWRTTWKLTETMTPNVVIKTLSIWDDAGRFRSCTRWRMQLRRRRRRWNIPLRDQARAVRAKAAIPPRALHMLESHFKLSGGFESVLQQSDEWPELPGWVTRIAGKFAGEMTRFGYGCLRVPQPAASACPEPKTPTEERLDAEAYAVRAQRAIPSRAWHMLDAQYRLSGGLDAVLRQSSEWPEVPAWLLRTAERFKEQMTVYG